MRVLIDMNLSTDWVEWLVQHGHEAAHWSALGDVEAGDDELINMARSSGSVILTNDLDFGIALITVSLTEPSVIQLRAEDLRPAVLGPVVVAAIARHSTLLEAGVLLTIDPRRTRVRLLALGEAP